MPGGSPRGCPASPFDLAAVPRSTDGDAPRADLPGLLGQGLPRRRRPGCSPGTTPSCTRPTGARPGRRATSTGSTSPSSSDARGFLRETVPYAEWPAAELTGADQAVSRRSRTSGGPAAGSRGRRCRARPAWPAATARIRAARSVVGGAGAHRGPQVGLLAGEQAVAQLTVGGEPDPVAGAAERPGHRADDADPAGTAVDQPLLGGRAAPLLGSDRGQRRTRPPAGRGSRRR